MSTDDVRLIQVFLSRYGWGIFEVYANIKTYELTCTCPGFRRHTVCKHVAFVARNGSGPEHVMIGLDVVPPPEAILDSEAFRKHVLRYGRPLVM